MSIGSGRGLAHRSSLALDVRAGRSGWTGVSGLGEAPIADCDGGAKGAEVMGEVGRGSGRGSGTQACRRWGEGDRDRTCA